MAADCQLTVAGKTYYLGMTTSELTALAGSPSETLPSISGYTWYVFGTANYSNFFMAGIQNNKVIALCSAGKGFSYQGAKMGDVNPSVSATDCEAILFTDINDNNILHAVLLTDSNHWSADNMSWDFKSYGTFTSATLAGESKVNFHLTNAFRAYHGRSILQWSSAAATSALLHSEDMAKNDYFSHTNLNGKSSADRMTQQGIRWYYCGENISAGYYGGINSYDGWVNSSGHRNNMLNANFEYLGVGKAIDKDSTYYIYNTQNFYAD